LFYPRFLFVLPGEFTINPASDLGDGSTETGTVQVPSDDRIAPMRFLFCANTPRDPNLGAAGCDLATIEALRGLGHQVDEIWGTDMPQRIAHRNLHQLLELPRNFAKAVAHRCAQARYDVIQVNQPHAYLAAKAHRLSRRPGVFVNRSHGWEPCSRIAVARLCSNPRPLWRRVMSRGMACVIEQHNQQAVRWSDGLVLCSRSDRDYVIERHGSNPDRLLALAPGVPPDFFIPVPPEARNELEHSRWTKLLYVGNFAPYKGPDIAAEVFREVLRVIPECRATWVCPQKHHTEARELVGPVAAGAVTFLDWMPRDQLRTLYDRHGLILIPSYFEGFSLTFLEAMARGLCVLGTMVGGLPQVIRHGKNGFLFRPGRADGFIERALQLVASPEECRKISLAAQQDAMTFTWERTASEYVDFCRKLIRLKNEPVSPVA
jgi:glycosyltransferase involved in cell wall biosynthesis